MAGALSPRMASGRCLCGVIFEEGRKDQPYPQYTGLLRSRVHNDYLRSLQQE